MTHAEGGNTSARGICSHAEGIGMSFVITISGDANGTEYSYNEDVEILENDFVIRPSDGKTATVSSINSINKIITLNKSLVD